VSRRDRPTLDSKAVDVHLRTLLWPVLKAEGFTRRTGRTTWRDRPGVVQTVNVQSFNRYLADVIGMTTFSFGVNLGVYYEAIADVSRISAFVRDPRRPPEWHCHARKHLGKGITQPNEVRKRWRFDPLPARPTLGAWRDRPDIWFVFPDGSNLKEVVTDARDRIVEDGLPWLERLSNLRAAHRTFLEVEETNLAPGIGSEGYGGALGSPNRREAVEALSAALGDVS
jgi:uncharacterized protein DUF4304